jgi:hypothetical protein
MEAGKARKMKSMVRIGLVMMVTAGLPLAAHARDAERRGRGIDPAAAPRATPQLSLAPELAVDPRQLRRDQREDLRSRRLSAEERRQLRRDINDAGRDLYHRPH